MFIMGLSKEFESRNRVQVRIQRSVHSAEVHQSTESDGRTHDGRSRRSCGGVGRNIAEALIKLGLANTRLISVVGDDEHGRLIVDSLGAGAETVKRLPDVDTARFTVVLNGNGECSFCINEMESFAAIAPELIREHRSHLEEASLLVLDANLPTDTMRYVLDIASQANVPSEFPHE
ncbi:Uncharacterized sugar kinase yeiC [Harpegnathos saltator]|uniref:Uncharacterized sugar kinase yeiC n=1 Tax=Harpegnathos saltator TaxID=610380 RepID=E2BAR4_HARSA|nr:Uncharacterized sugar kinase yeiC [Harpegnathos saltator]